MKIIDYLLFSNLINWKKVAVLIVVNCLTLRCSVLFGRLMIKNSWKLKTFNISFPSFCVVFRDTYFLVYSWTRTINETPLMVNFDQKNSYFSTLKLSRKKIPPRSSKYRVKPQWFQKNWLSIWWNHFWFHDNMTFFKISLIIAVWRVKVARFENENDDVFQFPIRLRMKNVVQVALDRSVRVIFYQKVRRLELPKTSKMGRKREFWRLLKTAW